MNIKITEEEHNWLCKNASYGEFIIGSDLWGTRTEESDTDILRLYDIWWGDDEDLVIDSYPNIHPFQYDCDATNTDYLWLTGKQFLRNLMSGDSTINAEVFMFLMSTPDEHMDLVRTYKVIKSFLGFVKRDVKAYKPEINNPKSNKRGFHAARGLYIAEMLLNGGIPTLDSVKLLKHDSSTKDEMAAKQVELRAQAVKMYESGELPNYFVADTGDTLLDKMLQANNIKEFTYGK